MENKKFFIDVVEFIQKTAVADGQAILLGNVAIYDISKFELKRTQSGTPYLESIIPPEKH